MIARYQRYHRSFCITFLLVFATFFLIGSSVVGQSLSPKIIISNMQKRLDEISDYSVIAQTNVDIPNLRMPDKKIRIFYKKPGLFMVKTNGFAIVPKVGFLPSITELIKDDIDVKLRNMLTENGQSLAVLELKPKDLKIGITTSLWIDTQRWTLEKVLVDARDFGESVINFNYINVDGIWLPEETIVFLNMKQGIPDMQRPSVEYPVGFMAYGSRPKNIQGKVIVSFYNYKVNQGIDDSVFEE